MFQTIQGQQGRARFLKGSLTGPCHCCRHQVAMDRLHCACRCMASSTVGIIGRSAGGMLRFESSEACTHSTSCPSLPVTSPSQRVHTACVMRM